MIPDFLIIKSEESENSQVYVLNHFFQSWKILSAMKTFFLPAFLKRDYLSLPLRCIKCLESSYSYLFRNMSPLIIKQLEIPYTDFLYFKNMFSRRWAAMLFKDLESELWTYPH